MLPRFMSFLVWALLGSSLSYWVLQVSARPLPIPAEVQTAVESRGLRADLGRLLGVSAAEPSAEPAADAPSRLRLLGVVAPRSEAAVRGGEGVALIDVDGVARTVRVGARVDGELHLLRVDAKSASLGPAGRAPSQVLQLSPLPAPATGSLAPAAPSPVVLGGAPAQPAPMNEGPPLPLRKDLTATR